VSEAVKRLRAAIVDVLTDDVRQALRDGRTIAQAMTAYPAATKRFVEEQRAFLKQTEGLADTRKTGTGKAVADLTADGFKADEIAQMLGISTSRVYQCRREQKKEKLFREIA
jgi:DNA-binding NarL/FixJ family response regulator